ncbi:MAG: lipoyl(octanoyl) transferase LipB [Armatimonadetes bacterium]|nr:lipoyl(octanoyl) transferase LipB [Armatimonadota bacterium]
MRGRSIDLGRMGYVVAWDVQRRIANDVIAGGEDTLLFVEHDPVMTLGASFQAENLLLPEEEYARRGIQVVRTDRGGDVTYHGPRQLVVYPIFDVGRHGRDLHKWMRGLEETIIRTLAHFGLSGERSDVNTGVWAGDKKIAAIGVKVRKWVSLHGIALNCDNDLKEFSHINPCGITTHGVTNLSIESGESVSIKDALPVVKGAFEEVFEMELQYVDVGELLSEHDA